MPQVVPLTFPVVAAAFQIRFHRPSASGRPSVSEECVATGVRRQVSRSLVETTWPTGTVRAFLDFTTRSPSTASAVALPGWSAAGSPRRRPRVPAAPRCAGPSGPTSPRPRGTETSTAETRLVTSSTVNATTSPPSPCGSAIFRHGENAITRSSTAARTAEPSRRRCCAPTRPPAPFACSPYTMTRGGKSRRARDSPPRATSPSPLGGVRLNPASLGPRD